MTEIKGQVSETHEGKQRNSLLGLAYGLIVIGITIWMTFADALFVPDIIEMVTDSDNKYYPKLVFLIVLVIVGAALFPFYWIVKKIVAKKNQNEVAAMPVDNASGKKEFSFSYAAAVNTVVIDDMYMQVKMGFVKRTFLLSRLRNFYLVKKNQYLQLYITYEAEDGKIKKCPLNAEANDQQVQLLNQELENRFPGKSLNKLSQKEAFKIMKVMSPALMVTIVLVIILGITAGIIAFAVME